MQNGLNTTGQTPQTDNPQGAAPAAGGNNAKDFQQTAPINALNEQSQTLSVQETGEPLPPAPAAPFNWTPWLIGLAVIVVLSVLAWGVRQLFNLIASDEADGLPLPSPAPAPAAAKKTAAKKKSVSKTKSGKPAKKGKGKPARKRR